MLEKIADLTSVFIHLNCEFDYESQLDKWPQYRRWIICSAYLYIGIKNNNMCIHKCDATYNLHFNSYLEPLKVPFYVCTYYLGTYNVENIKSNWSYAFFYIFLQKKDYILCISTLKWQFRQIIKNQPTKVVVQWRPLIRYKYSFDIFN